MSEIGSTHNASNTVSHIANCVGKDLRWQDQYQFLRSFLGYALLGWWWIGLEFKSYD